jgi:carbamoyltransferase
VLPPAAAGFVPALNRCATVFDLSSREGDQRLEALARLRPGHRDREIDAMFSLADGVLTIDANLEGRLGSRLPSGGEDGLAGRASLASAIIGRLAELFVDFLSSVRSAVDVPHLCVGGSFFHNSSINTTVRQAGVFERVFVPVDPGNGGLAVGAACHAAAAPPTMTSPFLGPLFSAETTKMVLDNCKLHYAWESEDQIITSAVKALREGRLVGWFDDRMEWGPRALGARSIFADPTSPYVLENLNRFLKKREPWRGYSLCGTEGAVAEYFDGPATAPFMECDYRPRDRARFGHVLPVPEASIRIQTLGPGTLPRLARLIDAFAAASGLPFLINSSYNGFHEPIVCSPRDAVRVFYGTGLDMLVINQFVLRK